MENIYRQFEGMIYQQLVGIPMGTNCAPLIAELFLFCYEWNFMSKLHKSKYKKILLLRCIHHFISEFIYNTDHMRISGTEPSSVILSQTS